MYILFFYFILSKIILSVTSWIDMSFFTIYTSVIFGLSLWQMVKLLTSPILSSKSQMEKVADIRNNRVILFFLFCLSGFWLLCACFEKGRRYKYIYIYIYFFLNGNESRALITLIYIYIYIYRQKGDKIKRKCIGNLTILYCEKGRTKFIATIWPLTFWKIVAKLFWVKTFLMMLSHQNHCCKVICMWFYL